MELEPLRLFLQVAATGSFSRAAALASSTQSAVSKRIGALERQLEARLFERTGRGARLTPAGRRLLPRAEALTAEVDRLPEIVADDAARLAGVVRLAVQPSASWPLVGDLVAIARRRHPNVRLQIAEGPTRQIEESLADGRVDLGVVSLPPPPGLGESDVLFDVPLRGSLAELYLAALVFITANLSLGITISTLTKTQFQAMQMSFFTFLPQILLSGFMFPFAGMPQAAQYVAEALPLTHFLRLVRGIMLRGADLTELWPSLAALGIFITIMLGVAVSRVRKRLD